jgi:LEA14-like dessication related protein
MTGDTAPKFLYTVVNGVYPMSHLAWPLLCVLVIGAMLVTGCSFLFKQPEVSVTGVSLTSLNLTDMTLDVSLSVNNPNSMGITLASLSFDVFYQNGNDWNFLAHGEQSGIKINPGTNNVTVPVVISNRELLGSLIGLFTRGEITLQVRGVAKPDFYGLAPSIPFTQTKTIPLRIGGGT